MSDTPAAFVVPVIPDIHSKIYVAASRLGALNMNCWHTCETTHCRAGWTVQLAGDAGRKLEDETSTLFAAMQIYKASGYEIVPARFFDSNEDAMADMKRLAEEDACRGIPPVLTGVDEGYVVFDGTGEPGQFTEHLTDLFRASIHRDFDTESKG